MNRIYDNIHTVHYCIMPNHVHLLITITENNPNGAPGASLPTKSALSDYIGTLKRFCNKKFGENIWQTSFHDHIIRDEYDYMLHLQYIDENPKKWLIGEDEYYA